MIRAVYPGSFDPFTNGHLDIAQRGAAIFDELVVAILVNSEKQVTFSVDERRIMAREALVHLPNVEVKAFDGMLVDFMRREHSRVILRGLRALSDFEYEFQRALLIKHVDPDIETVFMMTSSEYSFVSSSATKELAKFGGSIRGLVPANVEEQIVRRLNDRA